MSVRNALLGLLAQKPRHGYELRAAFEAVIGDDVWKVKPAQIYITLERLEESGLVARESDLGEGDEPSRRIYSLTAGGAAALCQWFMESVPAEHQRDEFFVKIMIALASRKADPASLVQTQRAHLFQELRDAARRRDALDPRSGMAQIMLIDKSIMHLEADLRWLDMVEVRLETIKDQPLLEPEIRRRGRPRKGHIIGHHDTPQRSNP